MAAMLVTFDVKTSSYEQINILLIYEDNTPMTHTEIELNETNEENEAILKRDRFGGH